MEQNDPAHTSMTDYISSHSKPNGGWRGFVRSNLFVALVIWFLGQTGLVGGLIISMYLKTVSFSEWRGRIDNALNRMDKEGTTASHYEIKDLTRELTDCRAKVDRMEQDTRHIEVIESEHRRLTKDIEEIKEKIKK